MKTPSLFTSVLFLVLCLWQSHAQSDAEAWINEIHYTNSGSDINETIEVVIENPSNYTLGSFTVHLYNGHNGQSYDSQTLDNFTLGTAYSFGGSTFQIYSWQPGSIQNGPDGMSLDYNGSVIQFLSYGGSFAATDGPANGLTATDIGLTESSSTLSTESLGLSGSGLDYDHFTWAGPNTSSFGNVNTHGIGQSFQTPSTGPDPQTGDLYPLGFNSDGDDEFSFVSFVAIPEGTKIYFTDEEYDAQSGFSSSEGAVSWTAPLGGTSAGTVVVINPSALSANTGAVVEEDNGFNLAASGDVLYLYLSDNTSSSGNFTFLSAFTNSTSWGAHLNGTGLTSGIEALYASPSANDNWKYNQTLTNGTIGQLKAAIRDVENNWSSDGGSGDQSYVLPTSSFTIAPATTYTYTGTWSPAKPAGTSNLGDLIDIQSGSVTLQSNTAAAEVKVASGATLTVNAAVSLIVSDKIENNGTVNVQSTGALVQTSGQDENSGTGTYNISREITAADHSRFNYWSAPVAGETFGDVFAGANASDWYYWQVAGQQWSSQNSIATSTELNRGAGYLSTPTVQNPPHANAITETRTFSASSLNNARIDSTYSALADDFMLVGNPYASALDADAFIAANSDLSGTLYFWDHSGDEANAGYASYNGSGATRSNTNQHAGINASGGLTPTGNIASCQGFFVAAASSSPSVVFTNAMRISGSNGLFFKRKKEVRERIWLSASSDSGAYGQILLSFDNRASSGYDRTLDGEILKANPLLSFYSWQDSLQLAIQALPKLSEVQTRKVVPLGLDCWQMGQHTIAIDSSHNWPANNQIYLIDSLKKRRVNLLKKEYHFYVNQAGVIEHRFFVEIAALTRGGLSVANYRAVELGIYVQDNRLFLNDSKSKMGLKALEIFSLNGKNLLQKRLEQGSVKHEVNVSQVPHGIYLLRLLDGHGQFHNFKIYLP